MSVPSAKIIADSISPDTEDGPGIRLTTMEVSFHRFVLAEFNTHRVFSRNSASSRAIPLEKQLAKVRTDPAVPLVFPKEQKGMQGGEPVSEDWEGVARTEWLRAAENAAHHAKVLGAAGVHKSVDNRLLEPFIMHTVVVTATAWDNFFLQRCSPMAQPEIRAAADLMREAYEASKPRLIHEGEWHLPYVSDDPHACEYVAANSEPGLEPYYRMAAEVSAARCAGVSYETQGSTGRDPERDHKVVYRRLVAEQIESGGSPHWSPLEHTATPWSYNRQEGCIHFGQDPEADHDTFSCMPLSHLPRIGNLLGWRSLRTTVETEMEIATYA